MGAVVELRFRLEIGLFSIVLDDDSYLDVFLLKNCLFWYLREGIENYKVELVGFLKFSR